MPPPATIPVRRICPRCNQPSLVRRIRVGPSATANGAGSSQTFRCRACGYKDTGATAIIADAQRA